MGKTAEDTPQPLANRYDHPLTSPEEAAVVGWAVVDTVSVCQAELAATPALSYCRLLRLGNGLVRTGARV